MPNKFRNLSWKKFLKWLLLAIIAIIILVVLISFQTTNVQAIPSTHSFFIESSFYNLRTDSFIEFYDEAHGCIFNVTEDGITRNEFIWRYDSEFGIVSINDENFEEWQLYTIKEGLFDEDSRTIYERYAGLISKELQGKKALPITQKNELLVTLNEEKQYAKTIIKT